MIRVSAGIIRNAEGRILVCQRGEGHANAHLWEFPGGKQEPGEDEAACLRRELTEELRLPVSQLRVFSSADWNGIHFTFITGVADAEPVRTEHEAIRFVVPRDMLALSFCPADTAVARRLALTEPRLRALFWDFDGTLFDTYPMMTRHLAEACRRHGIEESGEDLLALMKISLGDALRILSEKHRISCGELAEAYRIEAQKTGPAEAPLMPGMDRALHVLYEKGVRHFLVTHRDRGAVAALRSKGLDGLFTDCVTSELGFPRKPDPASVRWLIEKHGLNPETVCMIGDRPLDIEAGHGAGTLGCLFDPDHRFDSVPCELRAASADELPGLLCPD